MGNVLFSGTLASQSLPFIGQMPRPLPTICHTAQMFDTRRLSQAKEKSRVLMWPFHSVGRSTESTNFPTKPSAEVVWCLSSWRNWWWFPSLGGCPLRPTCGHRKVAEGWPPVWPPVGSCGCTVTSLGTLPCNLLWNTKKWSVFLFTLLWIFHINLRIIISIKFAMSRWWFWPLTQHNRVCHYVMGQELNG